MAKKSALLLEYTTEIKSIEILNHFGKAFKGMSLKAKIKIAARPKTGDLSKNYFWLSASTDKTWFLCGSIASHLEKRIDATLNPGPPNEEE